MIKKLFIFFALLASCTGLASAQGAQRIAQATSNENGYVKVISSPYVTVCSYPACAPVNLYQNVGLSVSSSNPVVGDANGNYMYYATPGTYIESVFSPGTGTRVLVVTIGGGGGGSSLTLCGVTNDIQLNGGSDLGCDTTLWTENPSTHTANLGSPSVGGTMIVQGPAGGTVAITSSIGETLGQSGSIAFQQVSGSAPFPGAGWVTLLAPTGTPDLGMILPGVAGTVGQSIVVTNVSSDLVTLGFGTPGGLGNCGGLGSNPGDLCYYNGATWVILPGNTTSSKILQENSVGVPSWTLLSTRECEVVWGGSGTSFALTSGDDAIANQSCLNNLGATETIAGVFCRSDAGSNTTTVTPTFGATGTGTSICSGALTCGSSGAYSSSCTVSNASLLSGYNINPVMGGSLTGTSVHMVVVYTVPVL